MFNCIPSRVLKNRGGMGEAMAPVCINWMAIHGRQSVGPFVYLHSKPVTLLLVGALDGMRKHSMDSESVAHVWALAVKPLLTG